MNQLTQKDLFFDSRVALVMAACLLTLLLGSSYAQTGTSTVLGVVTDQQGSVIADATVTLRSAGKEFIRSQTTDGEGGYAFKSLPPDSYIIQVVAPGFKKLLVSDVNVGANLSVEINVTLEVGSLERINDDAPIRVSVKDIKPPLVEARPASFITMCGSRSYLVKDSAGGYLMFTMHTPDMPHPLTVDNSLLGERGHDQRPLVGAELKLLVKLLQKWKKTAITQEKQRMFEHYNGLKDEAEIIRVSESFSEADSALLTMSYLIQDLEKSRK
jgi:hypothetical protein